MTEPVRAGLDEAEAARRLAEFGPNTLQKPKTRNLVSITASALREPMFILLLAASVLYLMVGDLGEGLFLTGGACVAVGLVVFQEFRSERALEALHALAEPYARVVRGGAERRIPAHELVPGDLLLVGEGERLPADAVLVSGDVLSVDEAVLTGEAAQVSKQPSADGAEPAEPTPGGDGGPHLFAGTMVVRGQGLAEVRRTGARTAIGRIGASLADIEDQPTALQRTAGRVITLLGVLAIAFCVVLAVIYGLVRDDWIGGVLAGITAAVSLMPEEFPMALAVFMALGAWRLARRNVLVRRSAAIEALGGVTVLCVDKTGTLTANQMTLSELWVEGTAYDLREGRPDDAAATALIEAAALASAARSADPMDRAIADLVPPEEAAGTGRDLQRGWPLKPERLAVVQLWRDEAGETAAAKGAPEAIFKLCRLPDQKREALRKVLDRMAARGLRVLAAASCRTDGPFPEEPEAALFEFRGLLGFVDPLRPEAATALEEAREAGIAVAMITGDYPATALEIARQAGIDVEAGAITGEELARLSPAELQEAARRTRVFARVQPAQKLGLVQAFQADGEVVAMTGDGVNDAPALEAADVGIAMGRRGTDVARGAADLVLLDDSFASIVGGVRLGRRIFANLRKALIFITAIHVPIAGLAILPVLLGAPPLLFAMHVVLLELVIDPVSSLVFESEPSGVAAMKKPPRDPREPLFGRRQLVIALAQGAVVLLVVAALYFFALSVVSEAEARGAAFAALVLANLSLALSDSAASGVPLFDRHRLVFWSIAGAALLVLTVLFTLPVFSEIFQVAPPPLWLAALTLAAGLVGGGWSALARRLVHRAPERLRARVGEAFGKLA